MRDSQRLIELRKKLGLSQRALAHEFGVTPGALAMWEKGTRPLPGIAVRLIEIYEEFLDEDVALEKHEAVIRKLSSGWAERLMLTFGSGARKDRRDEIRSGLENSLLRFFRSELSKNQGRRTLQVSLFNRVVEAASQTKGLPMKLVQMMTFLNPSMTPEARHALEQIHALQFPMAPTLVAKIIHEDFGQSPSKLFAEWSPRPFATASIGQVHLARLKTGEKVAVKVQYPDIEKSLKKDLSSIGFFVELAVLFNADVRDVIARIKEIVLAEADYYKEMEFLEVFGELFAGDEKIVIPRVHRRTSSSRVITMDYIEGLPLDRFKSAPEQERKAAAETLARFATATTFIGGSMNTDTHAGNFIFCGSGRVGFIDFGRAIKVETRGLDVLLKAVITRDAESARPVVHSMFQPKQGRVLNFEEIWAFFLDQQSHLHRGEFRFTRDHIQRTMEDGKKSTVKDDIQISQELVWSTATSMGLWNVLADLDVAIDYGRISLDLLNTL